VRPPLWSCVDPDLTNLSNILQSVGYFKAVLGDCHPATKIAVG